MGSLRFYPTQASVWQPSNTKTDVTKLFLKTEKQKKSSVQLANRQPFNYRITYIITDVEKVNIEPYTGIVV